MCSHQSLHSIQHVRPAVRQPGLPLPRPTGCGPHRGPLHTRAAPGQTPGRTNNSSLIKWQVKQVHVCTGVAQRLHTFQVKGIKDREIKYLNLKFEIDLVLANFIKSL